MINSKLIKELYEEIYRGESECNSDKIYQFILLIYYMIVFYIFIISFI